MISQQTAAESTKNSIKKTLDWLDVSQMLKMLMEFGVPKHSELETDCWLAKRDGTA